ncbi:MAG: HU family DNA-binding protein [Bacteroidaceae bacterium]|jgi:nucleoid DNA-binding protein|nr:HU family DNA-binding protein [Bacteroidaceae bacterium]
MNKFEFTKELARRLHITDTAAKAFVDSYNRLVIDKMVEGEEVKLQYFGKFVPHRQPQRPGRDPRNGEYHDIPERMTIKFKVSTNVIDEMNPEEKTAKRRKVKE